MNLSDVHNLPTTLTAEQTADALGCSVDHLYAMCRAGTSPVAALSLGRKLVWPTAHVLAVLGLDLDQDSDDHVVPIREVGA